MAFRTLPDDERRPIALALLTVTALASLEGTVVTTAMPTIVGELSGLSHYSWAFSVYLLTATLSMPVYGRLADLQGRRRLLLVSIALFLSGSLACALAPTMGTLIVARALQGLGAGGLVPISLTITGDLFSLTERGRVQGLFSAVWGLAGAFGPAAGAALTVHLGWRSVFAINLPIGLAAAAVVAARLPRSAGSGKGRLDVPGTLVFTLGTSALLVASTPDLAAKGGAWIALLFGLALLAVFVLRQRNRPDALLPLGLLVRRETLVPVLSGVGLGAIVYAVTTYVPLYVQGARGGGAGAAGAVLTPIVVGWAVSAALAGRLLPKTGFRRAAVLGAALTFLGCAGLAWVMTSGAPVVLLSVASALVGCGFGPSGMAQVLAMQSASGPEERGIATSLVPFFRSLSGALATAALGAVLAAGLDSRLGPLGDRASALLAGQSVAASGSAAGIPVAVFQEALGEALRPVFFTMAAVALLTLVAAFFFVEPKEETSFGP